MDQVTNTQKNMFMAVLAYLGVLIVIPFILAKDDAFVKFHIKQGLVLVVIEVAMYALGMFMWQFWTIIRFVDLAVFVLAILGIVNAVQGKENELPVVGSFAKNFKI